MFKLGSVFIALVVMSSLARHTQANAAMSFMGITCDDVISKASKVNELLGNPKAVKFVENCIKWGDGWRFKKDGRQTSISTTSGLGSNLLPSQEINRKRTLEETLEHLTPYYLALARQIRRRSEVEEEESRIKRLVQLVTRGIETSGLPSMGPSGVTSGASTNHQSQQQQQQQQQQQSPKSASSSGTFYYAV